MTAQSPTEQQGKTKFTLTWYHREEIQVLAVFVVLIAFFSRSILVTSFLSAVVLLAFGSLYGARIFTTVLHHQEFLRDFIFQYHEFKLFLGRESVHRSRVAMAVMSVLVIGVLGAHRITLASQYASYSTPEDLYWILFLGWYFLVCSVIAIYCIWIWGRIWQNPELRIPILDGLVASFFFYHGLSKKNRVVTFAMGFFLGGVPTFFATRINPLDPNGYLIALLLLIPVMGLSLGGALYARQFLGSKSGM